MKKQILIFKVAIILASGLFATTVIAGAFTLSDDDLMLLDRHLNDYYKTEVIDKRDVEGPGVEFDIRFPSTKKQDHSISYVSCKDGGKGSLVGVDISDYDAFALQFTLVSVNDSNSPDACGALIVGALVSGAYRPEVISLRPQRQSAISSTTTDANDISIIGITAHFGSPNGWDPNGSTVTLLVEPAPNAEILP